MVGGNDPGRERQVAPLDRGPILGMVMQTCGINSAVECQLPKLKVASSNLVSRSKIREECREVAAAFAHLSARDLQNYLRNPTRNPTSSGGSGFGGGSRRNEAQHAPNRRAFFIETDRRILPLHLLSSVT